MNCAVSDAMNIIIRTDSSSTIGSGHMMRCLTLAVELQEQEMHVSFICNALPGTLGQLAAGQGFPVYWLDSMESDWEADARATAAVLEENSALVDWLIVDHYQLDERWERMLRPYSSHIMVIDDLANRRHDCDLLLDANYFLLMADRYDALVPPYAKLLLGPEYALLRTEFSRAHAALRQRNGTINRIFVFFGGSDPMNETGKTVKALSALSNRNFSIDVVVGEANPYKDEIKEQCSLLREVQFFCQINNMAELMAEADLAIGAGGTTTWERCYLGLPSIVIAVADNQIESAATLAAAGAIHYLGFYTTVIEKDISEAVTSFVLHSERVLAMAKAAHAIVPHNGTSLVAQAIEGGDF